MATQYIYADKFFLAGGVAGPGYLEVTNGVFGGFSTARPSGQIVDYSGRWVAPGLVDTHIHGMLGHDVMDNDFNGVNEISKGLLACGVTSFLPTTLTADHELLRKVCGGIGDHYQEAEGAKIQGIFLEGPFFTEKHKGAQNPAYFADPSMEIFNRWQDAAHGLVRKIAIAPERDNAPEFTAEVTKTGVAVALGHSDATYAEAAACVAAGANIFVHTYNGMSGLHHREPGMVGAAMTTSNTYAELICDGHHVEPVAAKALIGAKTPENTVLITDCMQAGSMPEGNYMLGEFPVVVKDGAARLRDGGSLAGSILKLILAVHNVVDWNLVTPEQAFRMAALNPAKSCGIDAVCGSIGAGRAADFIVVTPSLELEETYLDGVSRYQA